MYPEICKIGPFTVYSYGLMLVLAFLVSSKLASIKARAEHLSQDTILNFAFIVFLCGIIGSRLFYVIENAKFYIKNPVDIIKLQEGGLSWFGGLALGGIAGFTYLKNRKLPIYKVLDLIAPFAALGQAIGRIGCLLNGCCFGKASEFGIYFPVHGLVLIPTQLYSSLALIFIFIVLRFLQDRPHRQGGIFYAYLLLYSLKRFFIELWRADATEIFLGLTLFQVISILVFFFACIGLYKCKNTS